MPDNGPREFVVIYSELGSEELYSHYEVFTLKEKAIEYIESIDNKCILVSGYALDTEAHT